MQPEAPQQQQQQQNAENQPGGNEDEAASDVEPEGDGYQMQEPPEPEHGWILGNFQLQMDQDWRGTTPKTEPYMNVGGATLEDMGPGNFFDCFFPWNYVRNEILPATNAILKEGKRKETNIGEMKLFLVFGLLSHSILVIRFKSSLFLQALQMYEEISSGIHRIWVIPCPRLGSTTFILQQDFGRMNLPQTTGISSGRFGN